MDENPYRSPEPVPEETPPGTLSETLPPEYSRIFVRVLLAQLGGGVLASLILDGGYILRVFCEAALMYWIFALCFLIYHYTGHKTGKISMFFLRHGTLVCFTANAVLRGMWK